MRPTSLRARQAAETRRLIVDTARELFTAKGFSATSIDDILERAGIARGALYHHFDGKDALFRAVYDVVQSEVMERALMAAAGAGEPWAAVRAGLGVFLDSCLEPAFRQIVVLDSVVVLDAQDWTVEPAGVPMLRQVVGPLVDVLGLPDVSADALVHVALGGLYGAALFIARADDPPVARAEADAVIDALVEGLGRIAGD